MKFFLVLSLLVTLSACGSSSKPERSEQPVPLSETATAQAAAADSGPIAPTDPVDPNAEIGAMIPAATTDVTTTPEVPYAEENTEFVGNVAQQVLNQKKSETAAATNQVNPTPATSAAGNKVLGWLKNGNTRFVKRRFRTDGQGPKDRARLAAGQSPHAIVFTCSDSRVPPEIIFDQKLGEIYVVRNDELVVNDDVLRSLEKGASVGAQLLVVLSYEGCASDSIKTSGGITSQSAKLAELETSGRLKIQPATYDLKTGVVTFQ